MILFLTVYAGVNMKTALLCVAFIFGLAAKYTIANEVENQKLSDFVEIIAGRYKNAKIHSNRSISRLNYNIVIRPVRVDNILTLSNLLFLFMEDSKRYTRNSLIVLKTSNGEMTLKWYYFTNATIADMKRIERSYIRYNLTNINMLYEDSPHEFRVVKSNAADDEFHATIPTCENSFPWQCSSLMIFNCSGFYLKPNQDDYTFSIMKDRRAGPRGWPDSFREILKPNRPCGYS